MKDYKVSLMSNEDLENIKDFLLTDFDDFWNYNILKQDISNPNSYYIVAKNSDEIIVGFAGVQFILDEADIMNIVTRKNYRGNGIGSLLLDNLIIASKTNNMCCITLEVNENNLPALSLYKKFGFKTMGIRKKYYNNLDNAVIMKLDF